MVFEEKGIYTTYKPTPFGFLEVFERDDNHGATRLAILFLGADGIAAYDALFSQQNRTLPPFVVILQDHGFGGNYDAFGRDGLLENIASNGNVLPRYLLVADNTRSWDGYERVVNVDGEAGGMHGHLRYIYQQHENVQLDLESGRNMGEPGPHRFEFINEVEEGMPNLCLKPVNDLLDKNFFIPAYQRGYRWTSRQVTDLLDDISSFHAESDGMRRDRFYCLQPVVVMARPDGDWELIDGQQRLTTIFLIMTFLRQWVDGLGKSRYSLEYETRPDSAAFLRQLDLARANENIDYFHICSAYQQIEQWFSDRDPSHQIAFVQCLLNSDDIGRNVKVIWYELPNNENPVDVFIRLNMGKIPLTNAELIRALFLRSRNFGENQITFGQSKIAQEWDSIEKTLQAADFWHFIYEGNRSYPTRIEYLFELIAQEKPLLKLMAEDPYYTFITYNHLFEDGGGEPDVEWLKVKRYFMTVEEWFKDRTLYHLVGYLIAERESLLDIKPISQNCGKSDFQRSLKARIFKQLFNGDLVDVADNADLKNQLREWLGNLSYESQSNKIRSVLLLFNIVTLLQNEKSNLRFPFDSYKTEQWDIEHIRSVKSEKPARRDDQKSWAENVLNFWASTADRTTSEVDQQNRADIRNEIRLFLDAERMSNEEAEEHFGSIYDRVLAYFGENNSSEVDNGLQNLALLDAGTNRSYKNAVFPIKRECIIELDKKGTFVPLCTTNAFLKYYSQQIDKMMFWTEDDRKDYFTAIVDTLNTFFSSDNGGVLCP